MISEVVMPQMGADMEEGTVVRWLKQVGDTVERGEIIAEIETDKANVEIEAFAPARSARRWRPRATRSMSAP
jgi:pyruvate dehydrogenase E2 component (dihydrolipoamide acetyltransferase)